MMKQVLGLSVAALVAALGGTAAAAPGYEVWAADQSNSVSGQAALGTLGSLVWIWDSADIEAQLAGGPAAQPGGCGRNNRGKRSRKHGPCDLLEVFPQDLVEYDAEGVPTGNTLADVAGFGRLHGLIPDPQNRYFTANIFAPSGSNRNAPTTPLPAVPFKDPTNTSHLGNLDGEAPANESGQIPGETTRRDAHGAATTIDGAFVHNVDRIQNVVEVFSAAPDNPSHVGQYDLTSADGQGFGEGPCLAASVDDDAELPLNDPAPDLLQATPDGKYMAVAFRGPAPVTVNHSAQGSCPGVAIIEITDGGASGRLVGVLRTTNSIDTAPTVAPRGVNYLGFERSDVHGASVIAK